MRYPVTPSRPVEPETATVPLEPDMAALDGVRAVLANLEMAVSANWQGRFSSDTAPTLRPTTDTAALGSWVSSVGTPLTELASAERDGVTRRSEARTPFSEPRAPNLKQKRLFCRLCGWK